MKCPFCQQELDYLAEDIYGSRVRPNCHCLGWVLHGNDSKWEELTTTRKALDLAIGALKEQQRWFGVIRVSLISHLNNEYGTVFKSYDADPTVVNVKRANDILNKALEQINEIKGGKDA